MKIHSQPKASTQVWLGVILLYKRKGSIANNIGLQEESKAAEYKLSRTMRHRDLHMYQYCL